MQKEIEAKFLNQDHNEIRAKLSNFGATCQSPMRLIRRTTFDFPDRRLNKQGSWVRLREELDGSIELMLKRVASNSLGDTYEQPVSVSNYEQAKQFVLALGLEIKVEEESKRELWRLDDVEIMLDQWPWVPDYIEIEGPTEEAVKKVASLLGCNWSEAKFGSISPVYMDAFGMSQEVFESLEISKKFNESTPQEYLLAQKSQKAT